MRAFNKGCVLAALFVAYGIAVPARAQTDVERRLLDARRVAVTHLPAFATFPLPANRHWLSDVVSGAAVGIIAGRTVTSHEAHPFPVAINYIPGGVSVMYVRRNQ